MAVNKSAIFQHIADCTDVEMSRRVQDHEVSTITSQRYYAKKVTAKEIEAVLGLQFVFFSRRQLASVGDQFSQLPEGLQSGSKSKTYALWRS